MPLSASSQVEEDTAACIELTKQPGWVMAVMSQMTTGTLKDCKPGAYIMVDGEPCKVLNYAKSKPGKHGAAKVRIEVIGLFDEKKRQVMQPAAAQVDIPILDKKKAR